MGPGFKPPERRKASGRKRSGQSGHPGAGPELLPIERVNEVVEHHPEACRRCGTLLEGEDPAPARHQVIEIPPIPPLVIEQSRRRDAVAAAWSLNSAVTGCCGCVSGRLLMSNQGGVRATERRDT